ncbi:MAG: calcium/sodium antiporter [Mediterraneibacter faecis]|uniref:calcium/sodium antiporter n=1 Tax=Mediterraneibacter faecis TaxID=592978 RepID=UPI00242CA930|nr:calcium/sodium antiporter [Mediterraneibacter faecis]MCI7721815.1 calcium/sodium antiporter [Mediterraneibacter faecis]MDY3057585.1 calcium/sodium antiporter [Mediterraneibacter faecis]
MSNLFQSVPFAVVLLIIGFVFLVKGADAFVEGCSSIARRYHVPSLIIGMTIVAMGTSLPETAVSVTAAVTGNNALAVSNAVGSNIFNLMVVVGACTLFTSVSVQINTLKIDFPISILCAVLLLILGAAGMSLGHIDGVVFIILFLAFILYMIRSAQTSREKNVEPGVEEEEYLLEAEEIQEMSMGKSVIYILLGAVAIAVGSDWVVDGACTVAAAIGISQTLIGLTVVAFGTSLPELVTSIVAAKKGEVDMALGNVIGSNIFNILMVLGIAAAISPVAFLTENIIDIAVLIVFSVIGWIMAWTKRELNRKEGIIMLLLYAVYVVYICMR